MNKNKLNKDKQASYSNRRSRECSNSRKKVFIVTLVAIAIVISFWSYLILKDPQILPVKIVQVRGNYHRVDRNELTQTVMPYVEQGFFNVNMAALKVASETVPWVGETSLRRVWPDKIILKIAQQKPIARWGQKSLITASGVVFSPKLATIPPGLPLFSGPNAKKKVIIRNYFLMQELLAPLDLEIVRLELTSRRAWRLVLDNGMRISLGRVNFLPRLERFVQAYPKIFINNKQMQAVNIDLRYTNGMAIDWQKV